MKIHTPIFIFFVLRSTLILRSVAFLSNDLLGIAPEDEKYYQGLWSSGTLKCKDGSKTFTKAQFNDDFCDCFDGTDEPGTSACPNGKFYCRNAGHRPLTIFSSRVNDGICDCCDGSDEYDGKIRCKNTCREAGKVARDKLIEKVEIYEEGVDLRKHEVEQAKVSAAKDEAELLQLKNEEKILKAIVEHLKDHKERIEKAVEKERIQKEKEKQKKEAEESKSKEHKGDAKVQEHLKCNDDDKAGGLDNSLSGQDLKKDLAEYAFQVLQNAHGSLENEEEGPDATKDTDSSSRVELGREIGSRWTGKKTEDQNRDVDHVKKDVETSANVHNEENNGYITETDEDHDDTEDQMDDDGDESNDDSSSYDEEDEEMDEMQGTEHESIPSWFEKVHQTVQNFWHSVNPFQTPVDISEAEKVQNEYDEASGKLSKIRSRISRLTKKLGNDHGPEKEFYSLYGHCFETKQDKYVYKVCPFKRATQEEGYSTTRLGEWGKFEDSYSVMFFSNGDNCWNGPDRSLRVRLRCGLKVELSDIDEPSRCEYEATLSTPAVCLEEKLKELEDELEVLDREQPQLHDEF